MKRAIITALLCLLSWYIGLLLMMSWEMYDRTVGTNDFVVSFWMLVNVIHIMLAILLLFAPFGIIPYRHK